MTFRRCLWWTGCICVVVFWTQPANAADVALPQVPDGFRAKLFAREPVIRNPASMAFDARGRLFVGQGPQFRNPKPDTAGDTIKILIDRNDDGVVDQEKTFATGFNCIQSLAWKGKDLWVANSPDLTVVRDLDGDDEADQYVLVYTDLGNLEHGIHGLNWGPDGKLYMSKGNSKGLTKSDRLAPKPFRDLWNVKSPSGAPDFPPIRVFKKGEYKKAYHNPADDWGREGGILRCDDMGKNLEVISRGMRNPWDITFDHGFNMLGTDNDQTEGDKVMMPFYGAHFGWRHHWSYHWSGVGHLPTVPASAPLFEGSGTGIVFYNSSQFPDEYRNVFFIDDWLRKTIYLYRPKWDGALLQPASGDLEEFARAGRSLFKPSDIEVAPDGSLYVLGWGNGYGAQFDNGKQVNEGRVYRIWYGDRPLIPRSKWWPAKRNKPLAAWSVNELVADLGHQIPVWRVDAQNELVRRGAAVKSSLLELLANRERSLAQQTWLAWTLGRIAPDDRMIDDYFAKLVPASGKHSLNIRIQAIRILVFRHRQFARTQPLPAQILQALSSSEPRIRFEAVQAIWQTRQRQFVDKLQNVAAAETDRVTFYSVWGALRDLADDDALKNMLKDKRGGVRRAALLALIDTGSLGAEDVLQFRIDEDLGTAQVATLYLSKVGRQFPPILKIEPESGSFVDAVAISLTAGIEGAEIRYTLDGSAPTASSFRYQNPYRLRQDAIVKAALFRGGKRLGPIVPAKFHRLTEEELWSRLVANRPQAVSGNRYRSVEAGLKSGSLAYSDRTYRFTKVPAAVSGATYLMTANDDAGSRGDKFLSFAVAADCTVYVGHDVRIAQKPKWMHVDGTGGFRDTGLVIETNDTKFRLFARAANPGIVNLGGNTDNGVESGRSNYLVIIKPAELKLRSEPITMAGVLPRLGSGDVNRGRSIFFRRGGAQCVKCHKIDGQGNAFAPDLSDIGLRVKPNVILQSILEPSAVITEGFKTNTIVTGNGKVYTGIVLEETGLSLKIVQTDGVPVQLEKKTIEERRTTNASTMPGNLARLLDEQQVADLTAYLLTRKTRPAKSVETAEPANQPSFAPKNNRKPGQQRPTQFAFEQQPGKLIVTVGGKPLAAYEYDDPKIARPYLAHVRAPNGAQVTRNHPPLKGDSSDHATMHPGIWMAFGDISRSDFWRNRARVEHERFVGVPKGDKGTGSFAVVNRYVAGDKVVCKQTCSYTFGLQPAGTLLIIDSTFHSDTGDFDFGAQEEMGLGIRVTTPITVKAGGRMIDSEGRMNEKQVWGRQADWCDYSGVVNGERIGMTLMPDPSNFKRCWFHARDYGVLVANPFGPRAGGKGRTLVKKGDKLRMRFGVLLHAAPGDQPVDVKQAYQAFLNQINVATKSE